nr:hypothetical protein [Tanacetum cinerariifolium]
IADINNIPVPPVIQFGNFHVGESSALRDLLKGNDEVCVPGLMPYDLRSVHRGVKSFGLSSESKRIREFKDDEEAWVRGRIPNSLRFQEEPSIHIAHVPRADDSYVMVRDAVRGIREDEDVDTAAPWDTQPPESHGSPHDSQYFRITCSFFIMLSLNRLVQDGITATIRDERERVRRETTRAEGPARGPVTAPIAQECSFASFMKCDPTQFHGIEGAVGLIRWFEKMENTFEISECAELRKVKFATATLHGRALTWWNSQVATLEVQRLEDELRYLKLRDMNIAAYIERFNELVLLCPDAVPNEKKKVELYIKGLPKIIKGETTSSRPVTLNEAVRIAHELMEQKIQSKNERIAEGLKRKWEN